MRCWCTGDEIKEARVGLKKLNKPIEERATLSVWFIHKKTESTDQLRITKNPERPQKTIKVDDGRIFSMVKKTNFTRSNLKKRLKEVRVSLSAIKRRLHEYKYRRFTTRCKAQDKKTSYMIFMCKLNPDQYCGRRCGSLWTGGCTDTFPDEPKIYIWTGSRWSFTGMMGRETSSEGNIYEVYHIIGQTVTVWHGHFWQGKVKCEHNTGVQKKASTCKASRVNNDPLYCIVGDFSGVFFFQEHLDLFGVVGERAAKHRDKHGLN